MRDSTKRTGCVVGISSRTWISFGGRAVVRRKGGPGEIPSLVYLVKVVPPTPRFFSTHWGLRGLHRHNPKVRTSITKTPSPCGGRGPWIPKRPTVSSSIPGDRSQEGFPPDLVVVSNPVRPGDLRRVEERGTRVSSGSQRVPGSTRDSGLRVRVPNGVRPLVGEVTYDYRLGVDRGETFPSRTGH